MNRKISMLLLINVIILLMYMRFGSLFFWVVGMGGFLGLGIIAISLKIVGGYAPSFYDEKLSQPWKKMTGISLPPTEGKAEAIKRVKLATVGLLALVLSQLLIYYLIKRYLN